MSSTRVNAVYCFECVSGSDLVDGVALAVRPQQARGGPALGRSHLGPEARAKPDDLHGDITAPTDGQRGNDHPRLTSSFDRFEHPRQRVTADQRKLWSA